MNRKLLFVVLSLAMLAGGVSVGIHVLHKQALADGIYCKVRILQDMGNEGIWP